MLFDIDGTLMRGVGHHHKRALIDAVAHVSGRAATLDGVATAGTLDLDLIANMLQASGESKTKIESLSREITKRTGALYQDYCRDDLSVFVCRDVRITLAELHSRGAVTALVTGNLEKIAWRKMDLAGLRHYFPMGAFSEDGSTRGELAQVAAERAIAQGWVTDQARVSLIGDHPNDIQAAKANGFQSIAVATGVTPLTELKAHTPDIAVEHLGELDLDRLF